MPVWPHPNDKLTERVTALHQHAYDTTVPRTAVAPATWCVLGEHTDHVGGIVINSTARLQVALAASPREDDTIMVTSHELDSDGEVISFTGSVTLSEIAQHTGLLQHGESESRLPLGGPEVRLGGVLWSMVNRQYLSRETKGYNITVLSEVPARVGLGDEVAAEVAFATILAESADYKLDPPLRARLADICASSAQMFSAVPSFRARYTAALRGSENALNVVDYFDGSVTHAPHPDCRSFLVTVDSVPQPTADISLRHRFVDQASAAFGVNYLRRLPDATERVTQWLVALQKADSADGMPGVEEAHRWLSFYEREIERAAASALALRARKTDDVLALLRHSQEDMSSLYGAVPDQESQIVQLCLTRGAVAARSAAAGLATAVIVYAPAKKAPNLIADLAADGFVVVEL